MRGAEFVQGKLLLNGKGGDFHRSVSSFVDNVRIIAWDGDQKRRHRLKSVSGTQKPAESGLVGQFTTVFFRNIGLGNAKPLREVLWYGHGVAMPFLLWGQTAVYSPVCKYSNKNAAAAAAVNCAKK